LSEKRDITTMNVTNDTLKILRELSERTHIPLLQIMSELAKQIDVVLKQLSESDRVIYMASAVKGKNYVVLNFASMFCGTNQESLEKLFKKED
jgi:N-acetylmuramic acid 6-phosphate (MurNAc-6-P) etherase